MESNSYEQQRHHTWTNRRPGQYYSNTVQTENGFNTRLCVSEMHKQIKSRGARLHTDVAVASDNGHGTSSPPQTYSCLSSQVLLNDLGRLAWGES